ncbi:MAG: GNAT family protein [Erysipelotrichaceae bacterium]
MLATKRLTLRPLTEEDAKSYLEMELKNRALFSKFSGSRNAEFYTLEYQIDAIRRAKKGWDEDMKYNFGIYLNETGELIGGIALNEVMRGALQSCYIGYSLDEDHNGKGYMSEAVMVLLKFAFEELKLHRIEAGVMPVNIGSQRVLEKCGFVREGLARKNVNIQGKWQDHYSYGIINPADDHE